MPVVSLTTETTFPLLHLLFSVCEALSVQDNESVGGERSKRMCENFLSSLEFLSGLNCADML